MLSKKDAMTIFKDISHFQNNTWSQNFFFASFFTNIQVKVIEVSCFTSWAIPKLETQFDWLVSDILYHAWSTLEIHHMLFNALRIIIWNRITKTPFKIDMIFNLCHFCYLLCCPRNGDFVKRIQMLI